MKSILITGVAGLIGSRMAQWIIDNKPPYQVIGIDNLSGGYVDNIPESMDFINFYAHDLAKDNLDAIFERHDIEYVFHFAAYAAEGLSPFIRRFNYENNLVATANIVNNCIKYNVKRLVFTSSMAVYGQGNPPFSEEDAPNPIDPYGVAKYACEMDIKIAGEQHGLDWCIIRPHNVYGINQNIWDRYRNVLGIWMNQKLKGKPLTIFGDGMQQRAFSYIDDCLDPLWNAMILPEASREVINLGGTKEVMINDVGAILSEIMNYPNWEHLEARHEVKHAYPTFQKSIDLLGYSDKTSLQDGLTAMWQWAQKQPMRKLQEWDKYELDKGIYDFWK